MNVNVRGKNKFEPTEAIKNYATDKLQKLNQYFRNPEELTAHVLCKVYDSYQVAEVTIPTKRLILRAESKDETIYGAIDIAIDKLETQIKKPKSKIYKSFKKRENLGKHYAENTVFDIEKFKTQILATNLVKSKQVDLKPMTPDDAILQMEMLGHNFFLFINIETNKPSVVYLREDHNYGIIEGIYEGE
jgi:putative sigma-54 modulation protein